MTDQELRFDGRVAIVTGAGRGIGREHALLLGARGAAVVVNDSGAEVDGTGRSTAPADDVVSEIRAAGGTAAASHASVADDNGPASIVQTAIDEFGRLDIVVNNAGFMIPGWLLDYSREDLHRLFEVHMLGTVGVTQAAWPHFVAASYGRVVNTISAVWAGLLPGNICYGMMKGAIASFTLGLALEVPDGVRVNAVAPTAWTRMGSAMPKELFDEARAAEMRVTRPVHLCAPMAAYLAHESCELNGELMYTSGGDNWRFSIERGPNFATPDLTIEDIAANIGTLVPS